MVAVFAIIFAVVSAQEVEVFPQLLNSSSSHSLTFSPDGSQILSGSGDGIKLWDIESGRLIRTFTGHSNSVRSVAFSPDGTQLISGSSDKTIILWDITNSHTLKTLSGHSDSVNSVAFSYDGKLIVSGSSDSTIKLWDTITGRLVKTFSGHSSAVTSVVFSPNGKQVLSGGDTTVKLWDIATGNLLYSIDIGGGVSSINSVAFSPDGKYTLTGLGLERLILSYASTGQPIRRFQDTPGDVYTVAFSPDSKRVVAACDDFSINLWDTYTGQKIKTFSGNSVFINSIAFNPDSNQILSGSSNGSVNQWDIIAGRKIRDLSGHSRLTTSVTFSSDGQQILSGSRGNTIKLWDTNTGIEIKTFSTGWNYSAAFNNDSSQIISGLDDYTIKLWDVESGTEIRSFGNSIRRNSIVLTRYDHMLVALRGIISVSFNFDDSQILSGSYDGTIKLWNTKTGSEIRTFSGHSGPVMSVKFSPDGKQILSGSRDGTIKLWNPTTGRETRTFSGHSGSINSVAFSPDGNQILYGSSDRTIKLFDTTSSRIINTFFGHTNEVMSVAFSPDGSRFLSGSSDGTIRLWDIATGKEIVAFISFSGSDTQLLGASRDISFEVEEAASSIDGEWVVITPDGYYAASPRGDRYLNVRIGNTVTGIDSFRSVFYNPDVVRARLAGEPDPPSKATVTIQQAARFMPPEVSLQTQTRTTSSPNTSVSISINDKNLPIQSIIVMNNGRRLGVDELSAITGARGLQANRASLAVTGNQQTLNLTLPINLDPGDNRIEVVAFNGYSENRRFVDITWDAPTGNIPALPDLWILAIGVNKYDNAGAGLGNMSSLNYCVADARGVINSLKAQEGKRYGKVHTLLVADDAEVKPTTANIRQSLRFLERASDKDVVLLFLAGHGMSAQDGQFFFLPSDARVAANRTVDPRYAISGDEIVSVLDAPGNRLVFIDACHAGGVDNDRMIRKLMDTNAFVFASSRGNEFSYELPELGHGVFTYSVIDALRGTATAARAAGNVSVISMSGFVSLDVPRRTDRRQHPSAYSLGFYDFALAGVGE